MTSKIYLSLFIICLFSGFAFAQPKFNQDLKDLRLNGKVKTLRETSFQADIVADEPTKGKRKTESPKWAKDFYVLFDEKGNITEKSEYKANTKLHRKLTYQYDNKGNLMEEKWHNPDGIIHATNKFTYEYDSITNKLEKKRFADLGIPDGREEKKFDVNGNVINETSFKANDRMEYDYHSLIDEKSNLKQWSSLNTAGKQKWKAVYVNDENGNPVEETWYNSKNKFIIKYQSKYDAKGNQTEIKHLKKDGTVKATWTYKYTYDALGNWIEYIQYKNNKPEFIVEREISYY